MIHNDQPAMRFQGIRGLTPANLDRDALTLTLAEDCQNSSIRQLVVENPDRMASLPSSCSIDARHPCGPTIRDPQGDGPPPVESLRNSCTSSRTASRSLVTRMKSRVRRNDFRVRFAVPMNAVSHPPPCTWRDTSWRRSETGGPPRPCVRDSLPLAPAAATSPWRAR